jgi:hypothetical protein
MPEGVFVIALKPSTGAVQAIADKILTRFKMGSHDYTLYLALPLSGATTAENVGL